MTLKRVIERLKSNGSFRNMAESGEFSYLELNSDGTSDRFVVYIIDYDFSSARYSSSNVNISIVYEIGCSVCFSKIIKWPLRGSAFDRMMESQGAISWPTTSMLSFELRIASTGRTGNRGKISTSGCGRQDKIRAGSDDRVGRLKDSFVYYFK